jgi:hypothetical protein
MIPSLRHVVPLLLGAAAHYNVALGYWNEKRLDDAERSPKTAIAIEPRFAPAHLRQVAIARERLTKLQ